MLSTIVSILKPTLNQTNSFTFKCMPTLKSNDAVSKAVNISLVSLTLTQEQIQDVKLELLQHNITCHPDQLKYVQQNKAKSFFFALTL